MDRSVDTLTVATGWVVTSQKKRTAGWMYLPYISLYSAAIALLVLSAIFARSLTSVSSNNTEFKDLAKIADKTNSAIASEYGEL